MKVAAAVWKQEYTSKDQVADAILRCLKAAVLQQAEVLVFPALLGTFWDDYHQYLKFLRQASADYPALTICPGSFLEPDKELSYHSSCLIRDGHIVLWQRQLYLAKFEQKQGLSRGETLSFYEAAGWKMAIILSTDAFYPQVSRFAALQGVDLILSPMAIKNGTWPRQLTGVWNMVQSNLFFAVESGFKGQHQGYSFDSKSLIHAPLEATKGKDGFLAQEESGFELISALLSHSERDRAIQTFDPLRQLNPAAYKGLYPAESRGELDA